MSTPLPDVPDRPDLSTSSIQSGLPHGQPGGRHRARNLAPLHVAILTVAVPGIGWIAWKGGSLMTVVFNVGLLVSAFGGGVVVASPAASLVKDEGYGTAQLALFAATALVATATLVAALLAIGRVAPWVEVGVSWVGLVTLVLLLATSAIGRIDTRGRSRETL